MTSRLLHPLVAVLVLGIACGRTPPPPTGPPLRIGTSGDYPPFSFRNSAGEVVGLDVDVAREFARDSGRPLELVPFRWPDLARDLAADRFDLVMSGVTIRPERLVLGTFTRPIITTGAVIVTRRAIATKPEDLNRIALRIAVNRGGHLERLTRQRFPRAAIEAIADNQALFGLLESASVDAIVVDALEADYMPGTVRIGPLTKDRKAYLGRDPALVARLDAWLRAHEADRHLAEVRMRWLGEQRAEPRTAFVSDMEALLTLLDVRFALMPLVAAAKERRGRAVVDGGQEARVLGSAAEAAARHGVDSEGIAALFAESMRAGRQVQERFLASPVEQRPQVDALDLDVELRPALAKLTEPIVARAADVAGVPDALAGTSPEALAGFLDEAVPRESRVRVANEIVALRRTPSARP